MNFKQIIEFFNFNSAGIQSIFSILLFLATFVYVIFNSLMHREMVKDRKRVERPEISLRLERAVPGYHNLVVENISNIPIYNLEFNKFPSFNIIKDMSTEDIGFVKNGISYMGSKQKYESFFLDRQNLDDPLQIIEFEIKYENRYGKEFLHNSDINLSLLEHKLEVGRPFKQELIKELKNINNNLEKLCK